MIGSGKKQNRFEAASERTINRIAEGTTISGNLSSQGSVRIDGEFDGNLETQGRLVIGERGSVTGTIQCKQCEVEGRLDGDVVVEELLALKSSARVEGDVKYGQLSVEEGAVVTGSLQLVSKVKDLASSDRRNKGESQRKVSEAMA